VLSICNDKICELPWL